MITFAYICLMLLHCLLHLMDSMDGRSMSAQAREANKAADAAKKAFDEAAAAVKGKAKAKEGELSKAGLSWDG